MRPNPLRWLILSYGLCLPLPAQELSEVRKLNALLQVEIQTEADLARRRAAVGSWLAKLPEEPRGEFSFLSLLGRYYSLTGSGRDRATEELF